MDSVLIALAYVATVCLVVGLGLLVTPTLSRWRYGAGTDVTAWIERFAKAARPLLVVGAVSAIIVVAGVLAG